MRGEERLYWVKDIGEPVSMEEILSGEIELPEDFRVENTFRHSKPGGATGSRR